MSNAILHPSPALLSAAFIIVAAPSFSAQTVPALIAYAKSHPGKLNIGSSPTGTPPYLAVSLFKKMANVDAVQVPFRNSPDAVEELLAGRLDVAISDMSAIGYVKSGRLHALGVTTANRQKVVPDVPGLAEFLPGYDASTWYGLGAAKGTPPEIIKAISTARLVDLGLTVTERSPAQFETFIASETKKWSEVIRAANIKPQ
jgi:tripartite-type tricarboxylate transporter receptor subunit TctC